MSVKWLILIENLINSIQSKSTYFSNTFEPMFMRISFFNGSHLYPKCLYNV